MHSFCLPETAWEMTSQHGQICDGLVLPKDSCIHVHAFMWWPPQVIRHSECQPLQRVVRNWSRARKSQWPTVQENLERQKSDLTIHDHRLISRGNGLPDLAQQIWLGIYNDLYYVVKLYLWNLYFFLYQLEDMVSILSCHLHTSNLHRLDGFKIDAASGASGSWFLSPRFHP